MTRNLEDAIDAVARELTEAASPVDLRARVVSEIAQVKEAEASFHKWRWLAAAAAIVLVAYLVWPARRPPASGNVPVTASVPFEQSVTRVPPAVEPEPGRSSRVVRPRAASGGPEATVASIPALAEPAALDIAPLVAASTELPRLTVSSLEFADLDIKPLTPPQ